MTSSRPTYLGRLCDAGIEGCWLAAVVATPLFFNVFSHRVFEPDKTTILRILALTMGLAWIVRTVESRGWTERRAIIPMAVAAVLVLAVGIVATVFSVAPRISLWGSYNRLQGLYTTAAYVCVFLSVVGLLRTRAQIERLISAALLTSLPVSLYGIIQYFGTDPLGWGADVTVRVSSTLGNPIFLAAFLILTVPLTLYRLLTSGSSAAGGESVTAKRILILGGLASLVFQMLAWMSGPTAGTASAAIAVGTWVAASFLLGKPVVPFLRIGGYTVLLSAQLMCLLFSQSRGPWLALAGGFFLFGFLWVVIRGSRREAIVVIGSGLAVVLVLGALNWPGSPLGFVRDVPYVGRLGQLTKTETGSGRVRVLIWEGVTDLIGDDTRLQGGDKGAGWVRILIGHGPESMSLVIPPHHPPELDRIQPDAAADRAHNELFDVLVTTGLVGLALYLLFVTGVFYTGLRWIGLLQTRKRIHAFLWLWLAGGGAGVAIASLLDGGWRFIGIALPIGMYAGLLIFVCSCALKKPRTEMTAPDRDDHRFRLLGVAMLTIVTGHFLETQIGLAIVATKTYFWVAAAVLVAGSSIQIESVAPARLQESEVGVPASTGRSSSRRTLIAGSLVVSLILLTLIYNFYLPSPDLSRARSVLWLVAVSWVFSGLVVTCELWADRPALPGFRSWVKAVFAYALVTVAAVLFFLLILAAMRRLGVGDEYLIVGYVVILLAAILVGAFVTIPRMTWSGWIRAKRLGAFYVILAAGVVFAANESLDVVRADVHLRKANGVLSIGRHQDAVTELRKAVRLEPKQDAYHLFLGKALIDQAGAGGDRDSLMQEAERSLVKARELSPLDPNHTVNLARLHHIWARETEPGATRNRLLEESLSLFARATALSPNRPPWWNERAGVYLSAGDTLESRRMYEHSLALDGELFQTHLLVGDLNFAQKRWNEAVASYQEVLRIEPGLPLVQLKLAFAKARVES